jgi:membrane-anchored glycerophosphoryl diester phosphodiesterase (GDPDase)
MWVLLLSSVSFLVAIVSVLNKNLKTRASNMQVENRFVPSFVAKKHFIQNNLMAFWFFADFLALDP